MRIGTITFHCAYNFGSALQTYALRKYLTNLGHDVHVIGAQISMGIRFFVE